MDQYPFTNTQARNCRFKVHDGPVKGISVARILEESGSDHLLCVTGSQDGTSKAQLTSINQRSLLCHRYLNVE